MVIKYNNTYFKNILITVNYYTVIIVNKISSLNHIP